MRQTQSVVMLVWILSWLPLAACAADAPSPSGNTNPSEPSEKLLAEVPEQWQKIVDRKVGDLHMVEYYPPGADDNWTQKLTVEALSGRDLPDPLIYVTGLAEEQRGLCDNFSDNAVFAGFENGYPTTVNILQCGRSKSTGRPVVTMVKIIQGNKSLYTVSRIWRLPAIAADIDTPPEVDSAELGGWAQTLRKVQVCDPRLDAHPCPNGR